MPFKYHLNVFFLCLHINKLAYLIFIHLFLFYLAKNLNFSTLTVLQGNRVMLRDQTHVLLLKRLETSEQTNLSICKKKTQHCHKLVNHWPEPLIRDDETEQSAESLYDCQQTLKLYRAPPTQRRRDVALQTFRSHVVVLKFGHARVRCSQTTRTRRSTDVLRDTELSEAPQRWRTTAALTSCFPSREEARCPNCLVRPVRLHVTGKNLHKDHKDKDLRQQSL